MLWFSELGCTTDLGWVLLLLFVRSGLHKVESVAGHGRGLAGGGVNGRWHRVAGRGLAGGGVHGRWRSWVTVCAGESLCRQLGLGRAATGRGASSWGEPGDGAVRREQWS